MPSLTRKAFERFGFSTAALLMDWPRIVGTDLARCTAAVQECFDSQDYIEGRDAFMQKRKPVFKGK